METATYQYDEEQVRLLYNNLLSHWNNADAAAFAGLFAIDGNAIGFDGSQMNGKDGVEKELSAVFTHHKTAAYISIIRELRSPAPGIFILRAVAGMIPPGAKKIKPEVNVIQTLVAQKEKEGFRIALFQNTPAAFHGRPELSKQLTDELQQAFDRKS
jgi:uncharacterized protein (TIGR02246 family)